MKNQKKLYPRFFQLTLFTLSFMILATLLSCDGNDPVKEDTPELITKATLTFAPTGGGSTVTVTATDPDGEGVKDLTVDGPINLAGNKTYSLSITLINELANPTDAAYNITEEVREEGAEHMLFFGWTNNVFANPAGNGNIDARADAVNYSDADANNLPIGLTTSWTTAGSALSGKFRVMLKHQPDSKSATSSSSVGETDLDIEFTLNVQ
jgi:hypothetical protein